ncbi:protein NLP1-like [Phoenix dactylifera]|uniref:Protein NLP1-like n=1 Tax=Phoenix dactylifera TaxID=42345 RepID=A0A8B8IYK4_PHODC|nr:protein NLP1-like [Phoenix dactylifera]XP_026655950.2 protein NLP1-like [Phoenix dactylifera]
MEDNVLPTASSPGVAVEMDLMDEFLSVAGLDCSDLLQPGTSTSTSPFNSSGFSPLFEVGNGGGSNPVLPENDNQDDAEWSVFSVDLPSDEIPIELVDGMQSQDPNAGDEPNFSAQLNELRAKNPSSELGSSWWIRPSTRMGTMEERLIRAINYVKDSRRDGDVLVQIWVPTRMGERHVLTTCGQPFTLDSSCQRLVNYRTVSTRYQFSAEENSNVAQGLPGRVFLGRVPEWTPDVRYFSSYEYPRVNDAQRYDVRGSLALPVFERNSRSCVGVLEVVMTTQKINYSSDLEGVCNALQAVDLRSSEVSGVPRVMVFNESYRVVLPEIQRVLRAVCETHSLPLAQTWISCIQQGKSGSRHSDENYKDCVSTVDVACYVQDPTMLGFHQACSEHHLLKGQGVAGKAFTTNQPCFSSDITSFSKTEYPLSHHAKLFHLRAAVAIRLRSNHTGTADFVLEFFLPFKCIESEEQKLMLNSLSITIQQVCQSLRVVTSKELEHEAVLPVSELNSSNALLDKFVSETSQRLDDDDDNLLTESPTIGISGEVSSWIASIRETQEKRGKSVLPASLPLDFYKQEIEGLSIWDRSEVVLPAGKIFSEFKPHEEEFLRDSFDPKNSFAGEPGFSNTGKAMEKRRTKTEKTISLQELRKYFAGSLKDAAKSLGVCPTTLKRICRHHGISRWPSRKIKKVGHSLRKLQVVIDSVHGPDGAFQFSSLYENFTKATWSNESLLGSTTFSTLKQKDNPESSNTNQQQEAKLSSHTSGSNSPSSSSSSHSSGSSLGCSSGTKQCSNAQLAIQQEISVEENQSGMLNKIQIPIELQLSTEDAPISLGRSQNHKLLSEHPFSGTHAALHKSRHDSLKVKAIYGEDKVILGLQPTWGFQDLKQEIGKRFNIGNINLVALKYLDDDSEWVLLTCDADLQECIDVYKSSSARTIKISVHHVPQKITRSSLGHTGLP